MGKAGDVGARHLLGGVEREGLHDPARSDRREVGEGGARLLGDAGVAALAEHALLGIVLGQPGGARNKSGKIKSTLPCSSPCVSTATQTQTRPTN